MERISSKEYTKDSFRIIYSRFSHEIRNPLSIVTSNLQLLSQKHPEIIEYDEWDTILNNLQYTQDLLKDFSDLNSAEKLFQNSTDIVSWLRDVAAAIQPSMDYLGIDFFLQTDPDLPRRSIDRIKMRQVLLNLLRNAQEAVPESGGRIKIKVSRIEDLQICISVSDNGCGISKEQLPDIFKPFVTYKKNGSGLGLAIARQIVEAHGGRLTVESSPDQGTDFHILL